MFNLKVRGLQILIEADWLGIAVGRRSVFWSRGEGWTYERVPDGYSVGLGR